MQIQAILAPEDPGEPSGQRACKAFDGDARHKIDIQLRPEPGDPFGQPQNPVDGAKGFQIVLEVPGEELASGPSPAAGRCGW